MLLRLVLVVSLSVVCCGGPVNQRPASLTYIRRDFNVLSSVTDLFSRITSHRPPFPSTPAPCKPRPRKLPMHRHKTPVPLPSGAADADDGPAALQILNASSSVSLNATHFLTWYRGPVLGSVQVTPLLYGTVAYAPRLLQFYTFLVSSPYMDVLAQYSIKGTRIGRGSVRGWYLEANPMAVVSDAQIQAYLKGLVKAKMISPNRNSYFPIHLGPNTTVILGGLQSCRDFCGYHRSFPISGISQTPYIYYSVIPDQSGACYGACGTSLDPFTDLTAVSAHEFAETVVNPGWGSAKYFASPLGWYNGYGGEIADICGSALDTLKDSNGTAWAVEKLWSNAHGKCITQIPPSNNTY